MYYDVSLLGRQEQITIEYVVKESWQEFFFHGEVNIARRVTAGIIKFSCFMLDMSTLGSCCI